jgi:secreted trypsin-like serine protease
LECRTPSIVSIVVGDWQRSDSSSTVRQTLDVELIKMHESYNSKTYANDISLVKVAQDIIFNENVQPVCAPEPSNDYTYYKSQCSGWGTLSSGLLSVVFYKRPFLDHIDPSAWGLADGR